MEQPRIPADAGPLAYAGSAPAPAIDITSPKGGWVATDGAAPVPLPPFDPAASRTGSSIAGFLVNPPHRILWVLRTFFPILRIFRWALVTRYQHVAEVLTRYDVFKVPFGKEIARLNDGATPGTGFILGMDDAKEHAEQLKLVMQAFSRKDIAEIVVPKSREIADKIAAAHKGAPFDAIRTLITGVPLELCVQYYGVPIPGERQTFAYATIELSGHLFGPPPISGTATAQVEAAGAYVRAVVDRAIAAGTSGADTVLDRLLAVHEKHPEEFELKHIRAILIGMITGFVPTNTMAGGHILHMLLSKRSFLEQAQAAARSGDDDLLKCCLFEAMRFMPLNPGPFRVCEVDYVLAADTWRAKTIRQGTKVLASTMSAMVDARQVDQPWAFKPGRPASDYMLFGYGMHWCAGVFIAQAQITQTFKALLTHGRLRAAPGSSGRLKRRGGFPDRLFVTLDQGRP